MSMEQITGVMLPMYWERDLSQCHCMSMEQITGVMLPMYWERDLSQCHCIHHRPHID